jgi:hypothetical protein
MLLINGALYEQYIDEYCDAPERDRWAQRHPRVIVIVLGTLGRSKGKGGATESSEYGHDHPTSVT